MLSLIYPYTIQLICFIQFHAVPCYNMDFARKDIHEFEMRAQHVTSSMHTNTHKLWNSGTTSVQFAGVRTYLCQLHAKSFTYNSTLRTFVVLTLFFSLSILLVTKHSKRCTSSDYFHIQYTNK